MPYLAPCPRAKGVNHPQVSTRAHIEKHALEQHVNYAPWCPHCARATALMRQHPVVSGDSPSMPTVSADFCFMKSRDADPGDGSPVLVMRESQTRSLFSYACAGKSFQFLCSEYSRKFQQLQFVNKAWWNLEEIVKKRELTASIRL